MTTIVVALCLLVAGAYKLRQPGTLPIRRVHFEDTVANPARAKLMQTVAPRLAGNFFTVDLQSIERGLMRLSWIEDAALRREWPDTLVIRIREQVAAAQWGRAALLNRAGQIFRSQSGQLPADLPILHGPKGRSQNVLARYRQLTNILKPASLSVRALVEDERRAWHVLLNNGIPIDIGRGNPDPRVARFASVYPEVLASRATYIESIDLRYTNGFAVAWKQFAEYKSQTARGAVKH